MRLIPSGEALEFLSQAAPRAWVHRLLCWMTFDGGLKLYSREGKVSPYCLVGEFFARHADEAGEFSGPKMDALIRAKYEDHVSNGIVGKQIHDRFYDEPNKWGAEDDPVELDGGFILFAEELDWKSGTLVASAIEGHGEVFELFFYNQGDHLGTTLDRAFYDAEISGLSFVRSEIEMLLPTANLQQSIEFFPVPNVRSAHIGRPRRWDWEGAIVAVLAEAQKPDGLPTGHGAQARIEEMIADWFTQETGECPSPSQVRQRAAKIMQMIERP